MSAAPTHCAILASGRSRRMGSPKFALVLEGRSFLARALDAAAGFETAVVVPPEAMEEARVCARAARIVANDAPDRGMTHALRLAANAWVDAPEFALAVLLADTPLVDAGLVRAIADARGDADVAYPVRAGRGGHPVVFGPRPLAELARHPDGDTLRGLRDDARWTRVTVPVDDDRPYVDVDTPESFAILTQARSRAAGSG